jgi:hypothetical protein
VLCDPCRREEAICLHLARDVGTELAESERMGTCDRKQARAAVLAEKACESGASGWRVPRARDQSRARTAR